jgi:hypothetical protein
MAATVKPLKKICAQIQSGGTYEEDAMFLLPFTSESLSQNYDPIEDESNVGNPFKDVPQQGSRHTGGSFSLQLDSVSIEQILEAALGTHSGGVFTFSTSHGKKLSLCGLNAVNAIDYANAYVRSLSISGSAGNKWMADVDLFSVTAQSRGLTSSFPSATSPADPFTFHEAGGTGYFRVGDQSNSLNSSDEMNIEDFNLSITCGFDEQFCNEGVGTLTPESYMVPPSVEGSFKLSRHDADTVFDWEDNDTALQLILYIYKNATSTFRIEIPNFKITAQLDDSDVSKIDCTMHIGRNGLGSSYTNSNIATTSPVRITVVNS